MERMNNLQKITIALCLGLAAGILPTAVTASSAYPFYFELVFEQQRIPLEGGTRLEANSFGFSYREHVTPWIGLALRLGRLGAEHEYDSAALNFDPSGYYAGLGFNSRTAERNRLQAGLDLEYNYYDSREEVGGDTLELDWTQSEARLWASLRLGGGFKFYGCVFALSVEAEQELKGTAASQQDLDNRDDSGQCAGLILETADRGVVGIEASGGARQGGRIYFGKYF